MDLTLLALNTLHLKSCSSAGSISGTFAFADKPKMKKRMKDHLSHWLNVFILELEGRIDLSLWIVWRVLF